MNSQTPRYRRRRSKGDMWRLIHTIKHNFRRFLPDGFVPMIVDEFDARVALGILPPPRPPNTYTRRQWRKQCRPAMMNGEFLHIDARGTGRAINLDNWRISICNGCHKRYWHVACETRFEFCSDRCTQLAWFHARVIASDPVYLNPVTIPLRYWCYTHNSYGHTNSRMANLVLRSNEELMSKSSLRQYFDEHIPLTTEQQDALRDRYAKVLEGSSRRVVAQINGTAKNPWTQAQVRLYLGLLDKVLPDANAVTRKTSMKTVEDPGLDPASMSREQLEQLVSKGISRPKILEASRNPDPPSLYDEATTATLSKDNDDAR